MRERVGVCEREREYARKIVHQMLSEMISVEITDDYYFYFPDFQHKKHVML